MPTTTASPLSRTLLWAIFGGSLAFPAIVATPRALAQDAPAAATAATTPQIHSVIAASAPDVQAFNEHLIILASPWMEGRLPGTKGMERAMDYMEAQFKSAGLEPAFQPSDSSAKNFRQPFSLGGKREIVEESIKLNCANGEKTLDAGTDFKLTSLGTSGSGNGVVAFVGYGIENGPEGFTSFSEGHSLEGKIAMVLRFEPMDEKGSSRWSGGDGWSGRAGFQGQIAAIAKRNPSAIIVVNTPGANDPRVNSLTAGGGATMANVPVFMMSTSAAEQLVSRCDAKHSLMELRKIADEIKAGQPMSFDLGGPDATVAVVGRTEEKTVNAENVVGLLQKPKDGGLSDSEYLTEVMSDHGYRSSWFKSQAPQRTGVPWDPPSVLRSHNVLCGRTPHAPSASTPCHWSGEGGGGHQGAPPPGQPV